MQKKWTSDGSVADFNPNKYKVDQVIDALRSTCYHKHNPTSGSVWLDGRSGPKPQISLFLSAMVS